VKLVTLVAKVDEKKCTGCKTCQDICPTLAIVVENKLAKVNHDRCRGCGNCNQRCPALAVEMIRREKPIKVYVDPAQVDYNKIEEICAKAKLNPDQLVCYCTSTRAEEVATAILLGATTPEKISLQTGIRTGCKVECIQPALRLLEAAGITPDKPQGYQWYGRTPTIWDIPETVKEKYSSRGFYFDQDIALLDRVAETRSKEGDDSE